jgi:ornithine decarboxylase
MPDGRHVAIGAASAEQQFYEQLAEEFGTPLLIYDSAIVCRQYAALSEALPNVRLYFAVKSHPHEHIIRTIDGLGGGFDVASAGETDLLLKLKVFGRQTIHTHPIKKDDEIRTALRFGVTTFVVDNLYELKKLEPYRSRVGVLLRLSVRSKTATVDLSRKFGCRFDEAGEIVRAARSMGLHVKGLSFHVGSQCVDSEKHVEGIEKCAELMESMNQFEGSPLNVLDIGGGFPADYARTGCEIHEFCGPVREALASLPEEWDVIAEPGRFLIAAAVRSITSVVGKSIRDGHRWYYLDDGVYGSFSGQIYDHATYPLQVLRDGELFDSVLAGPTCDSIDMVADGIRLPDLEPGDLVIGHEMGAYTAATKTRFNSLPDAKFVDLASRTVVP